MASLTLFKISVYESTIEQTLSKKNIATRLMFARDREPEDYWKNVLWTDES